MKIETEIEYQLGVIEDEWGAEMVCLVVPSLDVSLPLPDDVLRMITELAVEVKAKNFLNAVNGGEDVPGRN